MTKAELLKLLEPFPDDTLVVVGSGHWYVEDWEDVADVSLMDVIVDPCYPDPCYLEGPGRKYTHTWDKSQLDIAPKPLQVIPAIGFLPCGLELPELWADR